MKSLRTVAGHFRRPKMKVIAEALLCALLLVSAQLLGGQAVAAEKDMSLDKMGDQGAIRVRLQSSAAPIPLSKTHQWTVHLSSNDGQPVVGASIQVDGGMPEHGHGLPTKPQATPGELPGDYIVNGMKFSMTGWWVIKLAITALDGREDRVTFNVVL